MAAAVAVLLNLLATAAAFGAGAALLGFHSQGFVDAWAPLFFFCLSFALAMDYSVSLHSSVRDEFERTRDVRLALVEGWPAPGA